MSIATYKSVTTMILFVSLHHEKENGQPLFVKNYLTSDSDTVRKKLEGC